MTYSRYIGRVGALAVALGIGAAVATTPGIAFADGTESDAPGAEAPSNPSPNEPEDQQPAAGDPSGGDEDEGSLTDPPDMNVGGTTIDTSTNDGSAGEDEQEDAEDVEEEVIDEDLDEDDEESESLGNDQQTPPANNGSGNAPGSQQQSQNTLQQQPETNTGADDPTALGAQRKAAAGPEDNTSTLSLRTTALDNAEATGPTETFSSLALDVAEEEEQNPIAALISLPFRIVSEVLTAIVGGPNTPPGENPLFLGLLAFVRRPFETFSRSFSNEAPVIDDYSLVENPDGTFTITVDTEEPDVDAFDPDGDDLTFSATDGEEGTVVKTGANTFVYTPGDDFDGDDTFTLTVSDPGGLFGANRKTDTITVEIEAGDADPTEPEVIQPPTQQPDGTVEAKLEFDPTKVADVTIAEGFEPKYWNVQKTYNAETGELELKFTPTQAGMLRAALELPTIDSVGLQVTTTEETLQTFSMRAVSFAALAEEPDFTLELPDLPAGNFQVRPESPIFTSPSLGVNAGTAFPAGVYVTDRYAYVLNSRMGVTPNPGPSTVTVFGADPDNHPEDYLQVIKEIPVGKSPILAGMAGDRLYVANLNSGSGGENSTISVIDTDGSTASETDDNTVLTTIVLDDPGAFNPLISPDGKRMYVINQLQGKLIVINTDPGDMDDFNKVINEVQIAEGFGTSPEPVDNGDGSQTTRFEIPISGVFNEDGSKLYLVRDLFKTTQYDDGTDPLTEYVSELVVINTETDTVEPNPIELGYGGFAATDGKYLYLPTLDLTNYAAGGVPTDFSGVVGGVTIVDIQGETPVLVKELPAGNLPINIAFSPDKSLAYVVDTGTGKIWVIDTANQQVLDMVPGGDIDGLVFDATPGGGTSTNTNVVAASPDGTQLFVTNFATGELVVLEFVLDDV